jgi:two-component sensor histidine kinase
MLRLEKNAVADAMGRCAVIAASIANQQRIVLESARQVMEGTAAAPPVRALDAKEAASVFGEISKTNPYFAGMTLVGRDGSIVASSEAGRDAAALDDIAARAEWSGAFIVGSFSSARAEGALTAAVPVRGAGAAASGALVADLDIRGYASYLSFAGIPDEASVAICDRDKRLLYRYPAAPPGAIGRTGSLLGAGESFAGVEPIDADGDGAADAYVAAEIPRAAALAQLYAAARGDAVIVAMAALLSLAAALAAARLSIVSRVAALAAKARRYEGGDLRPGVPGSGRRAWGDELGELASAMDSMALAIRSREESRDSAEGEMRKAVEEREVLLREVNHRVYNNFQLMLSLMRLQAFAAPDEPATDFLRSSESRILAMALVHEKLYRSERLAGIDVSDYLESALTRLRQGHPELPGAVRFELESERIYLDIAKAIPFGLVANELVANCIEHAFAGRASGLVAVALRSGEDGRAVLEVKDDGSGMIPRGSCRGIGLQLARSLSEQLGGSLEISSPESGGTRAVLAFPLSA